MMPRLLLEKEKRQCVLVTEVELEEPWLRAQALFFCHNLSMQSDVKLLLGLRLFETPKDHLPS